MLTGNKSLDKTNDLNLNKDRTPKQNKHNARDNQELSPRWKNRKTGNIESHNNKRHLLICIYATNTFF